MKEIEHFLERVRLRPALYLGKKDLAALSHNLAGYEEALADLTGRKVLFNNKFQCFVQSKYGRAYNKTIHWSTFLLEQYPEEEAFDLFFALFDEFLMHFPHWEQMDAAYFKALESCFCAPNAFEEDPNTAVFTCVHVLGGEKPILHVCRDQEGDLQFLCGCAHTIKEARVISLWEACMLDTTIGTLSTLKRGASADRKEENARWIICEK